MKRATLKPADYQITDAIREWSSDKFGTPYLPDVYLEDWVEAAAIRGSTYADPERSLMRWVRQSSPSGEFYRPQGWESKLRAAKAKGNGKRACKPALQVAGIEVQPAQMTTSRDAARAALAAIKRGIA